jgi:hypothetical protein
VLEVWLLLGMTQMEIPVSLQLLLGDWYLNLVLVVDMERLMIITPSEGTEVVAAAVGRVKLSVTPMPVVLA